jgi:photosystem II stability/assembly factor-like uncharacterized protein
VAATNKGIYRSGDSGVSWSRVTISTAPAGFSTALSSVEYVPSGLLFGVSRAGGFYCSTDNGTTWQAGNLGGLPAVSFRDLKYMNGSLHVITDGGGVLNGLGATCP